MLNPAIWDLAFFLPEAVFGQFLRRHLSIVILNKRTLRGEGSGRAARCVAFFATQ
jgi:hypothetical protein